MSLFVYSILAGAGAVALIWRVKVAEVVAAASAPIGAAFTALALATGSILGQTHVGDLLGMGRAGLTSELVLLFLYLGYMALDAAIEDRRTAGLWGVGLPQRSKQHRGAGAKSRNSAAAMLKWTLPGAAISGDSRSTAGAGPRCGARRP
jgi:hypothetical protein